MVANASGTRPGGRLAQQDADPAGRAGAPTQRPATAAPEPSAADEQPGDGADVGEAAPPDAEHQQRAERRRGHREGQPDRAGDADVGGRRAPATQRHDARPRRRRPGTR